MSIAILDIKWLRADQITDPDEKKKAAEKNKLLVSALVKKLGVERVFIVNSLDQAVKGIEKSGLSIDMILIFSHNDKMFGPGIQDSVIRRTYWWNRFAQATGHAPIVAAICQLAVGDMSKWTERTNSVWYAARVDVYPRVRPSTLDWWLADKPGNENIFEKYDQTN